jgi:hypothetical protein
MRKIVKVRATNADRIQRLQEAQEASCDARAHIILQRDLLNEEIETLNRDIDEYERLIHSLIADAGQ